MLLGAVGLPFYAGGNSGWDVVTGATGGYLIGFIVAAFVVGSLAERHQDRSVAGAIPAFLTGSLTIYAMGVPWLSYAADSITSGEAALAAGFTPIIAGDLIKVAFNAKPYDAFGGGLALYLNAVQLIEKRGGGGVSDFDEEEGFVDERAATDEFAEADGDF